jgi:opacity protein-like surface antigen
VTRGLRTNRIAAVWGLAAVTLATAACHGGEPASSPSATTPGTPPSSAGELGPDGSDAAAILKLAFGTREILGGGSGRLNRRVDNTSASTPKSVLGVTFAFVCTGNATATLEVHAGAESSHPTKASQRCDGSIYQQSVDTPSPSPVGFQADVTGPLNGSFAYGYYTEKKQLP